MNKGKKKTVLKFFGTAIVYFGALALVVALVAMVFHSVQSLEHYNRVYRDPLEVTAVVTRYSKHEDSEGDVDYISHVTYSVNGTAYTVQYESENHESELTPIGTEVNIQVSREDPGRTIKGLRSSGYAAVFLAAAWSFVIPSIWCRGLKRKRSRDVAGMPDTETVERDIRLTIFSGVPLYFWPMLSLACLALLLRYSAATGEWLPYVLVFCALVAVMLLVNAMRKLHALKNRQYLLRRDYLANKESKYDSEDGFQYYLYFHGADGNKWSKTTSEAEYRSIQPGNTVVSVYMPGQKKPFLHYNTAGKVE